MPQYMKPVEAGALAQLLQGSPAQPPAVAPMPALNTTSVEEPPLPPVAPKNAPPGASGSAPTPRATPSDAHATAVSTDVLLVMVCAALFI